MKLLTQKATDDPGEIRSDTDRDYGEVEVEIRVTSDITYTR